MRYPSSMHLRFVVLSMLLAPALALADDAEPTPSPPESVPPVPPPAPAPPSAVEATSGAMSPRAWCREERADQTRAAMATTDLAERTRRLRALPDCAGLSDALDGSSPRSGAPLLP